MKKLLSIFGVVGLACLLFISPRESFESTSSNETELLSSYNKEVTGYRVVFTGLNTAPATYFYNIGGWSGSLRLDSWFSTGTEIIASYSGTVYCSGVCSVADI